MRRGLGFWAILKNVIRSQKKFSNLMTKKFDVTHQKPETLKSDLYILRQEVTQAKKYKVIFNNNNKIYYIIYII